MRAGLSKNLLPTPNERATHLPIDEATLRSLNLGPNADRIVELFRKGKLARGVLLAHDAIETPVAPHTVSVALFSRYGWYDVNGVLRAHRSDERDGGLLNHHFEPKRDDIFLVAYDPASKDHVIFYADGGARLTEPPPPLAPAKPKVVRPPPADLSSAQALLLAAHQQFDDVEALQVLADRLCELNDPRGQLMALQLARKPGEPPRPEESELLEKHARHWTPRGLIADHFERGFLIAATCVDAVDPTHLAWQTVELLRFDDSQLDRKPGPFEAKLPRLRQLYGMDVSRVQAVLPRIPRGLEVLGVRDAEYRWLQLLLRGLKDFTSLHTLELEAIRPSSDPTSVLELVLQHRPPRLTHVWVPAYLFEGLSVKRQLEHVADFVVHLSFGNSGERDRAWVEVTARELTLHQRGAPHRGEVIRARELLTACGVTAPKVYSSP